MSVRVSKAGAFARVMPRDRQRRPDGRPLGDLRPGERPSERRPIVTDGHFPVMVEEVLHFLALAPGAVVVDCTLGSGGHSEAMLASLGGRCLLVGVDRDPVALARAGHRLQPYGDAVHLVRAGFDDLEWIVASQGFGTADAVLLDLGMSSMQIDDPARGFSFRQDGPLDMRMDPDARLTAMDVVNTYTEADLVRVLKELGEERNATRVARAVVAARRRAPLRTTAELAAVVMDAYPSAARRGPHPARKTFQALRIEVNGELQALERVLAAVPGILAPGGRVVVLSYHSLEDRMVKRMFADRAEQPPALPGLPAPAGPAPELRILTRGAVLPSVDEIARNPRASSARLRAAERI